MSFISDKAATTQAAYFLTLKSASFIAMLTIILPAVVSIILALIRFPDLCISECSRMRHFSTPWQDTNR